MNAEVYLAFMKQIKNIFILLAMLLPNLALAQSNNKPNNKLGDSLTSYVAIAKSTTQADRYVFMICQAGTCETLGNPAGYSAEQINSMNGTMKQIIGPIVGVAETAVILYLAAAGWPIGASIGAGYFLLGVTGVAVGAAVPITAIHYIKSINPFSIYHQGVHENKIAYGLSDMLKTGEASLVIYQNTDLNETLWVANQIQQALSNLK